MKWTTEVTSIRQDDVVSVCLSSSSLLHLCVFADMNSNISLTPLYFHLTLFADCGPLRYLFFSLCLLIYMAIISANVVVIVTVCLEKSLHQPMYMFISCQCLNSLYGSAGFFPRFLMDLLSDTHVISRPSCFTQIYVIYTYVMHELALLTVMAYDRLVAICQPLHYHSKMTFRMVRNLVTLAVLYSACAISLCVFCTVRLTLCGNKLRRLFCSNWPVVHLSCVDTTLNSSAGLVFVVITIFIPLFFILYTYLHILLVCRRSSSEFRGKALQTFLPHIITFVTYSFSLFCDLSLSRLRAETLHPIITVVLSLEFLIVPPVSNPLVYSLNLPQIRRAIFRLKICQMFLPSYRSTNPTDSSW